MKNVGDENKDVLSPLIRMGMLVASGFFCATAPKTSLLLFLEDVGLALRVIVGLALSVGEGLVLGVGEGVGVFVAVGTRVLVGMKMGVGVRVGTGSGSLRLISTVFDDQFTADTLPPLVK